MKRTRTTLFATLILCLAASVALGRKVWYWTLPYLIVPDDPRSIQEYYLTGDNGSHAVAMTKYDGNSKVWTSILTQRWINTTWDPYGEYIGALQAYEYKDVGDDWHRWNHDELGWPFAPDTSPVYRAVNCHVANNPLHKVYTWGRPSRGDPWYSAGFGVPTDDRPVSYQGSAFWDPVHDFSDGLNDSMAKDMGVAVALFKGPNDAARARGVAAWVSRHMGYIELRRAITTDGGANWPSGDTHFIVRIDTVQKDTWWRRPSLATDDLSGDSNVYLAYESTWTNGQAVSRIVFRRSTDWGRYWSQYVTAMGLGEGPCVAAVGHFVFVSWSRNIGGDKRRILYRHSTDCGVTWVQGYNHPDTVPFDVRTQNCRYDFNNVAAVPLPDSQKGVLVVARVRFPFNGVDSTRWWTTRGMFARFGSGTVYWQKLMPLCTDFVHNVLIDPLNPSIAAITADGLGNLPPPVESADAVATCVMSTPAFYRQPLGYGHHIRKANGYYADRSYDPAPGANTARLLALEADGTKHYGCASWPYIATGQVFDGVPIYDFGATGKMPVLAPDADGFRWVAYVERDTLWCRHGYGDPAVVYAGSNSAVPGQPSMVSYPDQASSCYVSAVAFAVYDTSAGTSQILFARVCTSDVVLDTIESVADLKDSLPCINVYGDTLLVTWQHGTDSVLASMLCDYGPGTSGRPPAWTSPNLVTANGYHAMSRFDDNGTVLNVTWVRNNGSNYAIQRATCDLATTAFG
ncbi:hypothetical protein JXD38_01260, partial [candidate division WOR-3 bacterium]|nr:hypothetical protein [candidate division WOR-3 bacterium]